MKDQSRIPFNELALNYDQSLFNFNDTSQVEPLETVIGQQRALEAIEFGLNMKGPGYNLFVTGYEGAGKLTILKRILNEYAQELETPMDLCMVNNFDDPYCPIAISIPAGTALHLRRSMRQFIESLKIKIPGFFETDQFQKKQAIIHEDYTKQNSLIFEKLEQLATSLELAIMRTEKGYQIVPISNGHPVSQEEYNAFGEEKIKEIENNIAKVQPVLNNSLQEVNKINESLKGVLKDLVGSTTDLLISEQIDPIRYYFKECKDLLVYLERVKEDIIENISMFLSVQEQSVEDKKNFKKMADEIARRYQVNVLVHQHQKTGAPVIFESNPTFQNLFGVIEKKPVLGTIGSDFTMIQAGSMLRANNGFLVIQVESLLKNLYVWETLKTTLQNGMLQIEDGPEQASFGISSLKPTPIKLDVKVILLGDYDPFRALQRVDSKFNKIFRVRADFDYEVELTNKSIELYIQFIASVSKNYNLLYLTPDGTKAAIEYGQRLVADQKKLSLRFGLVLGMLKEADYWARKNDEELISHEHIQKAVFQHHFRHNLYEDKVMEQFDDQSILLDVDGEETGQVNALAVLDMGEIAFGRPSRITAETYMGKPGIINIENEAEMSGQTHDKGVMIISGFLGRIFAKKFPLSVSISITFEQSYSGIDGDSASSTELYAVLSSLSGLPIRQDIAVTGSVNQKGEIQAIGGVNEKIEGFFDVCKKKGFTKKQGVMIPSSNARNLILRQDVLKAIKDKEFHIYKVASIEEGIEILTGVKAGIADDNLNFSENTVFGKVQQTLKRYHELSVQHGK